MNLQEYAAHRKALGLRGTSHVAVLRAIDAERLTAPAVTKIGKRWVIEPALADAQWGANTLDRAPAGAPPQALPPAAKPAPAVEPAIENGLQHPAPQPSPSLAAVEAPAAPDPAVAIVAALTAAPEGPMTTRNQGDTQKVIAQAQMLWLDLGERQGQLISKDEADQAAFEEKRRARDTLKRLPLLVAGDISRIVGGLTEDQRTDVRLLMERQIAAVLDELSGQTDLDEVANVQG